MRWVSPGVIGGGSVRVWGSEPTGTVVVVDGGEVDGGGAVDVVVLGGLAGAPELSPSLKPITVTPTKVATTAASATRRRWCLRRCLATSAR